MIWWLVILLAINIMMMYLLNGKKLFSPTIIVNGVFLVSALFMLTNWDFFGYEDISFYCLCVVMMSIYALSFGELLATIADQKRTIVSTSANRLNRVGLAQTMNVSRRFVGVTCVAGIYIIVAGFISVYMVSLSLGNTRGVLYAVSYARQFVNSGNSLGFSQVVTYPAVFVKAASLYCMLVFCNNWVNVGKASLKLVVPGVLYCVYTITSTSRTGVLEIFCAFIIMFYATYMRKNSTRNSKLIRISIVIVLVVAIAFIGLGNLRTVAYEENTASDIVNYMGSPLIVFSRWLENYELSEYPGYATFPQAINILNQLGILKNKVSYGEMYSAEDVLAASKSNLKTWLRAPIQDFTVCGMLFSRVLIGFFYTYLVKWLMRKNDNIAKHPGKFIFACLLFYPLISAAFADKYGGYIQLETLYMALIFAFIGRRAKKWNEKMGKSIIS